MECHYTLLPNNKKKSIKDKENLYDWEIWACETITPLIISTSNLQLELSKDYQDNGDYSLKITLPIAASTNVEFIRLTEQISSDAVGKIPTLTISTFNPDSICNLLLSYIVNDSVQNRVYLTIPKGTTGNHLTLSNPSSVPEDTTEIRVNLYVEDYGQFYIDNLKLTLQ
ncbi:MAG: hypothetical protein IJF83_06145 [Methanobrevibacter sp.]|nr:hypothetical protein [Methanobrevibacter sp.]